MNNNPPKGEEMVDMVDNESMLVRLTRLRLDLFGLSLELISIKDGSLVSSEENLLLLLRCSFNGCSYHGLSDNFHYSTATTSAIVHKLLDAIMERCTVLVSSAMIDDTKYILQVPK